MDPTAAATQASRPEARRVDAGSGMAWWSQAWALFTRNAGMWLLFGLLLLMGMILLGAVPVLGGIAVSLLLPVFVGSWMLAARKAESGGNLEIGDLFAAFQGDKLSPLIVLGALMLVLFAVLFLVGLVVGLGSFASLGFGGMRQHAGTAMAAVGMGMLGFALLMLIGLIASMAFWFAPALVVLRGLPPLEALRASTSAVLANVPAFLLWGLLYLVAAVVASIPMGLGWLLLLPVSLLVLYVSYREVYGA